MPKLSKTSKKGFHRLDPELIKRITALEPKDQAKWLFLEESEEFKGRWKVEGLSSDFFFDFEDIIGDYQTLAPADLDAFSERVQEAGYDAVFVDDQPFRLLEELANLGQTPPVSIHSTLPETKNGFLPWQVRGFNKLIRDERLRGGIVLWTMGAGKTAFAAAAIEYHTEHGHPFDLALVVVKSNNKIDTQRKLWQLGDIESTIVDGTPAKRSKIYEETERRLQEKHPTVLVLNYEKWRDDEDALKNLVADRNILILWDEMPTRLRNRSTKLYKAVGRCLYTSWPKVGKLRPAWLRSWELTATPIENQPEDQYACLRLIDPDILGSHDNFHNKYAASFNYFQPWVVEEWQNLNHLGLALEHITDRVDRDDPEVAEMFPEVIEGEIVIDWNAKHRKIYDILTGKALEMLEADFSEANVLSMLSVLQMVCDAPSMLNTAASRRQEFVQELSEWIDEAQSEDPKDAPVSYGSEIALTLIEALKDKKIDDDGHTKLQALREVLLDKHPDEKALVFTTWGSYGLPVLSHYLTEWGIEHVVFRGTDKNRQAMKDTFRSNPKVRVFLSSDTGSDGIDLPEASVSINYNLPYKWTTKHQRRGRFDRVNTKHDLLYVYDLTMANSMEDRKKAIIAKKRGYHDAIFSGEEPSDEDRITASDYLYLLTGD